MIDALIEFPVVTSFTRLGYDVRSRLEHWTDAGAARLDGRTVLVTGATSGLGRSIADTLARCGATVVVLGRDPARTKGVVDELTATSGNGNVSGVVADMGDLTAVRVVAQRLADGYERIDVVVHNAGALSDQRSVSPEGIEQTVASQVVGPFLLTHLLLDRIGGDGLPGRVLTMSSGGMYAANLDVEHLEMSASDYRGAEQYARAKRAQVTLNEMWAQRVPPERVVFHAVHPGWADTPGVATSLPTFRRVVGPLLRTPEQGADTMVWLAADDGEPLRSSGRFWLDRRPRAIHKLPTTRRSDTPQQRARLWAWCCARAGVDDDA